MALTNTTVLTGPVKKAASGLVIKVETDNSGVMVTLDHGSYIEISAGVCSFYTSHRVLCPEHQVDLADFGSVNF